MAGVARELGLSDQRVYALIRDGDLPALRIGRNLLVDMAAVEAFQRRRPAGGARGRSWAPRTAWALLHAVDGHDGAVEVPARDRYRIRKRLQAIDGVADLLALGERLDLRDRVHRFRAHAAMLPKLRQLGVPAGVEAAGEHDLDLLADPQGVDRYVDVNPATLASRFGLRPAVDGDVVLREVPAGLLPARPPRLAVALDLIADADPRAREAGAALLERIADDLAQAPA